MKTLQGRRGVLWIPVLLVALLAVGLSAPYLSASRLYTGNVVYAAGEGKGWDELLGVDIDQFLANLDDHQDAYINTPYGTAQERMAGPGKTMDCSSFVGFAIQREGGVDVRSFFGSQGAGYPSTTDWVTWAAGHGADIEYFDDFSDMLAAGTMRKGDIVVAGDRQFTSGGVSHMLIHWADSPSGNVAFHETTVAMVLPHYKGLYCQISGYIGKTDVGRIAVIHRSRNGDLSLKKVSSDAATNGNDHYSLAGAKYGVYATKIDAHEDRDRIGTLTTNADGSTDALALSAGTYYVREVTASKGFTLDESVYEAAVEVGGHTVVTSKETPKSVEILVEKASGATGVTQNNASYDLEGAVYGVYRTEAEAKAATAAAPGSPVARLTTTKNGTSDTARLLMGTYFIKEISSSKGYALDAAVYKVEGTTANKKYTVASSELPQTDPVELLLQKVDAESGKARPQGSASLAGAEYTVEYYDNDSAEGTPKRTWVFRTNEEGRLLLSEDAAFVSGDERYKDTKGRYVLPVGSVRIYETKAPEGYLLNDEKFIVKVPAVKNSAAETIHTYNGGTEDVTHKEQVYRGGLAFVKIEDATSRALSGVPFEVISKTTGESHVVMTDKNGRLDTEKAAHTEDTNRNDVLATLSEKFGVWFNGYGQEEDGAPVSTMYMSLPYDEYLVEELPCEANEGLTLARFSVYIDEHGYKVERGTVTDDKAVTIGTTAHGKDSDLHLIAASETAEIIDTVEYAHAIEGQMYRIRGTLVLAEDPSTVLATAEKTFTAKPYIGTVDLSFTFDARALAGKNVVVFETMYLLEGEEESEVARHEDPTDEGQTVRIGSLETTAALSDATTIVDTVRYDNLIPGATYTLRAHLVDRESGERIEGAFGETVFTAEASGGTAEVTIDASSAAGQKVVVFEACYLNETLVGAHMDPSDTAQQVDVPAPPAPKEEEETPPQKNTPEDKKVPDKPVEKSTPKKDTPSKATQVNTSPKTGDVPVSSVAAMALSALLLLGYTYLTARHCADGKRIK